MAVTSKEKWSTSKLLALFSTLVILLIPTIGTTNTTTHFTLLKEKSFFWPWLIILRFSPNIKVFVTDQYNFITVPWSLFIFIPFIYALYHSYKLFLDDSSKMNRVGYIAIASLIQLILIWLTFQSQAPDVIETFRVLYLPEWILILVMGGFFVRWYLEENDKALQRSAEKRKAKEKAAKEKQDHPDSS